MLDNIVVSIKPPKTSGVVPDYLTAEELQLVYRLEAENAGPKMVDRNLLIFTILVELGLRVSELIGIKIGDVDLNNKEVWVTKKGGAVKKIPFNNNIKEQIETWLSVRPFYRNSQNEEWLFLATTGRQLNRKQVYEIVSNAIARAGLVKKRRGPHLFRHTGATLRSIRGDDIETIRIWLDHSTYRMSQVYNHAGKFLLKKTIDNGLLGKKDDVSV